MTPCPRPQQEISRGGGCGGGAGAESPARRAALFVLAVVCLGVFIEALLLLAIFAASDPAPLLSSPQWAAARLLTCIGIGGICALILRRHSEEG